MSAETLALLAVIGLGIFGLGYATGAWRERRYIERANGVEPPLFIGSTK